MNSLPFRTDLSQLRRQAKDLLQQARSGDPDARAQIAAVGPTLTLASAQLALARQYGFASWPQMKAAAERKEAAKEDAGWHSQAAFGSWFDEEAQTDRETQYHEGSCPQCGAGYAFETNIVRGFADYVVANCPACGASLGEFREDVGISITVRLAEDGAR